MRITLIVQSMLAAMTLGGCAGGHDRYDPPIVDTRNVDPVRYNKDLADCTDEKRQTPFYRDAQVISNCMTSRGYVVTNPRT